MVYLCGGDGHGESDDNDSSNVSGGGSDTNNCGY